MTGKALKSIIAPRKTLSQFQRPKNLGNCLRFRPSKKEARQYFAISACSSPLPPDHKTLSISVFFPALCDCTSYNSMCDWRRPNLKKGGRTGYFWNVGQMTKRNANYSCRGNAENANKNRLAVENIFRTKAIFCFRRV